MSYCINQYETFIETQTWTRRFSVLSFLDNLSASSPISEGWKARFSGMRSEPRTSIQRAIHGRCLFWLCQPAPMAVIFLFIHWCPASQIVCKMSSLIGGEILVHAHPPYGNFCLFCYRCTGCFPQKVSLWSGDYGHVVHISWCLCRFCLR